MQENLEKSYKLYLFLFLGGKDPGSGSRIRNPDPHLDKTLDPDPHLGLCGSETLDICYFSIS